MIKVVFCDCPGINENEDESFQTTIDNVETAHGMIFFIDAFKPNAGIEENKVTRSSKQNCSRRLSVSVKIRAVVLCQSSSWQK